MNFDDLSTLAALLATLSVASERLVEVIKKLSEWLDTANNENTVQGRREERRRRLVLHLLSIVAGIFIAGVSWLGLSEIEPLNAVQGPYQALGVVIALGILSSGGSSFWNSIQTYATQAKNLRKEQARAVREEVERPSRGPGAEPPPRPHGGA